MNYIKNVGDNQNKFGDTATVFQLGLMKDDEVYNFGDNEVTVNIANETGYVLSVTPDKSSQNTVLDLDFNKVPLKTLTPDSYRLEVEVKSTDGDIAKFPTSGAMTFSINNDLKETIGELVPTVTFDNVLEAVDEKIAVYMDTVKVGPQGPIGPAGNVDTSHDNTFTGANSFTQPIDARVKERGTLSGTVDALSMMKKAADNSGVWKLNGVTIVGSGQNYNDSIWGTLRVHPWADDGTGATLILNAVSGISNHPAQLITGGDSTTISLTWYKLADDASVVHNTGTETVVGDKTFTGSSIFTQLIGGYTKTSVAPSTDLNLIIKAGKYELFANYNNTPVGMPNSAVMLVENNVDNSIVYQFILSRKPTAPNFDMSMFFRLKINPTWSSTTWTPWRELAQNQDVVHNTGTETISGNKTFLSGNYGLRVTSTGIQKTSDSGTTWTSI